MKFAVRNRFSDKVQFTAEIDCAEETAPSVKLGLAVRWAIERGANLRGAYLRGAYLSGANLSGADLSGAKISDLFVLGYPDGWSAWTYITEAGEQRIQIGCRNMTLPEGRAYWANKSDRREVLAALDYAETVARIRGWKMAVQEAAE